MINRSRQNDSRRHVQRRFPPGTFVVCQSSLRVLMIVGWYPGPNVYLGNKRDRTGRRLREKVQSWYVIVLDELRVKHLAWEYLAGNWTLDEWNENVTT